MNRKYLYGVFSAILFIVVAAGMILNQSGGETARLIHRFGGQLSVVAGIIALLVNWKSSPLAVRVSVFVAILMAVVAGYAGAQLKDTADYSQMFNLMRGAGILAFILSVFTAIRAFKTS